ncbi:MAG: polysaccharide biosynthesis protein [Clostridiales bacterium]|nr:polysaccharide biosynthesis protein [Clostridiales bacterium]
MAKQPKNTDNRSEHIETKKRANVNVKALFSPRYRGVILTFIFDILVCLGAFWLARKAMFNQVSVSKPLNYINFEIPIMIIMTGIPVCMLALFNCYNVVWKFAGRIEFIKFVASYVMSYCVLLIMKAVLYAAFNVQLWGTQILLYVFLALVFTAVPRFSNMLIGYFKHVQRGNFTASDEKKPIRTVIYGAGNIGSVLNNRFISNADEGYMPVAFMDDDADKRGKSIGGNLVAGGLDDVETIIEDYSPDMFVIAITDITKSRLKDIYERISKYNVPIKMLPPISDANAAATSSLALRDIKIESLLGRDEFKVKTELVDVSVKDKVVMVTGGAGSIGSELCRQALTFGCKHLVIFDQNENGMFNIDQEFQKKFDTSRYSLIMGTVREAGKLADVLNRFKPETVFHAAAYKHVPMMEIAPTEAIKNNVFGTKNVIEQCQKAGVKRFVLISTDKAVNPANVMGASKRLAEMLVQTRGADGDMQMAAVRFGNVLGSSGSVIPTFLRQIQEGGPVTVTDRNIKRYFMTIPEAVRLVLQTGALASSGEVFVLDMGEPVYIYDLACNLIRLNGFVPNKDIQIVISGLRPGEKLFEELRYDQEKVDQTMHEGIFVTKLEAIDRTKFDKDLAELKKIAEKEDEVGIEKKVFEVVPRAAREQALKERESSLRAADAEAKMALAAANAVDSASDAA